MAQRKNGFTLVEALLATLILAAGVVTIAQLIQICGQNDAIGMKYERAWYLLNNYLGELHIEENFSELKRKGKVSGPSENEPGYDYQLEIEPATHNDLYQVVGLVNFQNDKDSFQVRQVIYIYDKSALIPME